MDLLRHRIVDVLPDREAHTLEVWLDAHPRGEVISRDRAGAYAQGARKGAPQAQQVTERFHVLLNLQEALKRLFERKQETLQEEASQQFTLLQLSEESVGQEGGAATAPLSPPAGSPAASPTSTASEPV